MPAKLTENSYGKSDVRLTKVTRHPDGRHDLKELSVGIQLHGDFARCYTHGDNSSIVPTDTMKNTVYALARSHPIDAVEDFADLLARHFLDSFDHVARAVVQVSDVLWERLAINGQPHEHSFVGGSSERRTCSLSVDRTDATRVESGIDGLVVLKTTKSGFVGFIHDKFTTLKETTDRIFATRITARWEYYDGTHDWNRCHQRTRRALLDIFATHDSLAVQQTLYAMGEAALAACDQIKRIKLTMPNQHHLLVNLQPFGLDNANEIFVPTDEPFGLISGTIAREE
jgi:urate oxidase